MENILLAFGVVSFAFVSAFAIWTLYTACAAYFSIKKLQGKDTVKGVSGHPESKCNQNCNQGRNCDC